MNILVTSILSGLLVSLVLWVLILTRRREIAFFENRSEREVGSDVEEELISLLGNDIGAPPRKIHLNDKLRVLLGYDVDKWTGEDYFNDLTLVLEPFGIEERDLVGCETVGDLVAVVEQCKKKQ